MVDSSARSRKEDHSTRSSRNDAILALGTQLSKLMASGRAFITEAAATFDPPLSAAAFQVVQFLHASGAMRSMQVAQHVAMDRSALSRLLGQLTAEGVVEACPDPDDRRATLYALSSRSVGLMETALSAKGSRYVKRLEGWSETDIRLLNALLTRLNDGDV
jgi:DNA-binding MarR family transcriptional regulator